MQARKSLALITLDMMSRRAMCHYVNMEEWGKLMELPDTAKAEELDKRLKEDRELFFGRKQEQ